MFYSDKPICSAEHDKLDRGNFSKHLAYALKNLNNSDTFSIGLYGAWGSGKTSVVNMMLQELERLQKNEREEERLTVVRFEPWNFADSSQLLTQFFVRLSGVFKSKRDKSLAKIGTALEKYADAFELADAVPVVGGLLAYAGKTGARVVGKRMRKGCDDRDIIKQKDHVVQLLQQQHSRLLVVIDDIDRLSDTQIRQVFQLVASVASFPNTIYLLVFDKEIVVKALEQVQKGRGEDYLEKVIQIPIQIPDISPGNLQAVLFDRLGQMMFPSQERCIHKAHWDRLFFPYIAPLIHNIRDIGRLCNAVQFKLAAIAEEIDLADLLAISILEIQFPKVYAWIRRNKSALTGSFSLGLVGRLNTTAEEWYQEYRTEIQGLLEDGGGRPRAQEFDTLILDMLACLFPHFGRKIGRSYENYDIHVLRRNNQIALPEKFDRYFSLDVDHTAFRSAEIRNAALDLSKEEFQKFLLDQIPQNRCGEFLKEIQAILSELPQERIKLILSALIEISAQLSDQPNGMFARSDNDLANEMILDLLDALETSDRLPFVLEALSHAGKASLAAVAGILQRLELGYGRLAQGGYERRYKKALSLEELTQFEAAFLGRTKQLLAEYRLFDFESWMLIYYLLKHFDPEYMKAYLDQAFLDDRNITQYIEITVGAWQGTGTRYELRKEYKNYLTDERVMQAIKAQIKSGDLFTLSERQQRKCAAFWLSLEGKVDEDGFVSQASADALRHAWEQETA